MHAQDHRACTTKHLDTKEDISFRSSSCGNANSKPSPPPHRKIISPLPPSPPFFSPLPDKTTDNDIVALGYFHPGAKLHRCHRRGSKALSPPSSLISFSPPSPHRTPLRIPPLPNPPPLSKNPPSRPSAFYSSAFRFRIYRAGRYVPRV